MSDIESRLISDAQAWRSSVTALAQSAPGSRMPRRWFSGRVLSPLLAAAAVLLVATTIALVTTAHRDAHPSAPTPTMAVSTTPQRVPASGAPIRARLVLATTTVKAGGELHGEVFITNTTAHDIQPPNTACNGLVRVGLTNSRVPFSPAWTLIRCPGIILKPGTTTMPVTIPAFYDRCYQGTPSDGYPRCITKAHNEIPALPPGIYFTSLAFNMDSHLVASAPPVQVTVTTS